MCVLEKVLLFVLPDLGASHMKTHEHVYVFVPMPIKNVYSHILKPGMEDNHSWDLAASYSFSLPRRKGKVTLDGIDNTREKKTGAVFCLFSCNGLFLKESLSGFEAHYLDAKCLCSCYVLIF